jgi:hypothetical protein
VAAIKTKQMQQMILKAIFQRDITVVPTVFYLGLGRGTLPNEDATLADLIELAAASGYARKALNANSTDFPLLTLVNNAWKIQSIVSHWAATADWLDADYAFLCDVASGTSGRLFAACEIDKLQMRNGDTYDGTFEYVESK